VLFQVCDYWNSCTQGGWTFPGQYLTVTTTRYQGKSEATLEQFQLKMIYACQWTLPLVCLRTIAYYCVLVKLDGLNIKFKKFR